MAAVHEHVCPYYRQRKAVPCAFHIALISSAVLDIIWLRLNPLFIKKGRLYRLSFLIFSLSFLPFKTRSCLCLDRQLPLGSSPIFLICLFQSLVSHCAKTKIEDICVVVCVFVSSCFFFFFFFFSL